MKTRWRPSTLTWARIYGRDALFSLLWLSPHVPMHHLMSAQTFSSGGRSVGLPQWQQHGSKEGYTHIICLPSVFVAFLLASLGGGASPLLVVAVVAVCFFLERAKRPRPRLTLYLQTWERWTKRGDNNFRDCNFTNFRCSFISVVKGITEIKKAPKWENYIEWLQQHPRTPKFKLNRTLRDRP